MPGVVYDARSRGAEAYLALAHEVLSRRNCDRPRRPELSEMRRDGQTTRTRQRPQRAHSRRARSPCRARAPLEVDIDQLEPNEYQPRAPHRRGRARGARTRRSAPTASFSRSSCAATGADRYQIIAGERRWRAAQRAGSDHGAGRRQGRPAATSRAQLLEMALIENIQRENLNPIDEAHAYQRLAQRIPPHAGRHRDSVSARTARPSPTSAPAEAPATKCAPRSRPTRCRWATRARCSRSPPTPISAVSRAT